MATVPLSGTNITLLSGVPFSNDYKHSRWFDDANSQYNYFATKTIISQITQANFQRIEGHTFISVNKSIDELWGCNYLMFQNASYNNKWFYAFVTRLEYVQRNTTYVHFEIDVLQTWRFDFTFKPSFVLREHCALWNADGSPVINTVDEGLNYGTEYEVKDIQRFVPYPDLYFLVIVSKSVMHDGTNLHKIIPSYNGLPQPLTYYIHPFFLGDGKSGSPDVNIGGTVTGLTPVGTLLQQLFTDAEAVNDVVAIYATEYFGFHGGWDGTTYSLDSSHFEVVNVASNTAQTIHMFYMETYTSFLQTMSAKYDSYDSVTESKLLMYPYTVLLMDDFKGNRQIIKNEYIDDANIELLVQGSAGTGNKISYNINNYLVPSTLIGQNVVGLEHGVINNSPNDVPIVADYLSAYLQGSKNTIENQKQSILFNGVADAVGNGVGGVASALSGNMAGVGSSITGLIKGGGNAVLGLQGINAKLKDIGNMPPNLVKMGGNVQFDFGNGVTGIYLIKKQITAEYQQKLTDFFNMYGYKLNEVKVPNLHTRNSWNYVQTSSCNITGNFNNEDLQELKEIFDGGITLWHTDDVGNYALGNGVI